MAGESDSKSEASAAGSGQFLEMEAVLANVKAYASQLGINRQHRSQFFDKVRKILAEIEEAQRGQWKERRENEGSLPWHWNWPQLKGLEPGNEPNVSPLEDDEREQIGKLLGETLEKGVEVRRFPLSFYPKCELVHAFDEPNKRDLFAIIGPRATETAEGAATEQTLLATLDGTSPAIHELNRAGRLKIDGIAEQLDYLRFFCMMVHGEHGPFRILEPDGKDIAPLKGLPDPDGKNEKWAEKGLENIPTLRMSKIGLDGRPQVNARVRYGPAFFDSVFAIDLSGMIEMLDDKQIGGDTDSGAAG